MNEGKNNSHGLPRQILLLFHYVIMLLIHMT